MTSDLFIVFHLRLTTYDLRLTTYDLRLFLYLCLVRIVTLIVFLLTSALLVAQNTDSVTVKPSSKFSLFRRDKTPDDHSPKKAAIFSAVLPGAGQIYNHQAWKVILLYGGLGTLGYFIVDNNKVYKDYLQQWTYLTDSDVTTNVRPTLAGVSPDALHNAFSAYRKYRDQCVMGFVLLYAANIIDANVYAHLFNFNVDNLSVRFTPNYNIYSRSFAPSLNLKYKF
jgi:hypothetical protein